MRESTSKWQFFLHHNDRRILASECQNIQMVSMAILVLTLRIIEQYLGVAVVGGLLFALSPAIPSTDQSSSYFSPPSTAHTRPCRRQFVR